MSLADHTEGTPKTRTRAGARVRLGGLLGMALAVNHSGRLTHFITDENSPAIALFNPEKVSRNEAGDWYGEHAGKWLYAAAKAAHRTGDEKLKDSVLRVAGHLLALQDSDGYLGNYAPSRRFMVKQPPGPRTWDGAPGRRTWDIWTHSYLVLGLLEVNRHFPRAEFLAAACHIGDLCLRTLNSDIDITELGNHHGMSATVLLDAAVELFAESHEQKYLDLALLILRQADARPELALLRQALAGTDAAEISTGKAYQLCWNLVGLAKLYRVTGDVQFRLAVENVWNSIRTHHLTLGGGPWGGVAQRSREVFNHRSVFSPSGYVETCATLSWIQLNRELLAISGEARYAEEIERAAYNDLLGAQAPDGQDWCYYVFPNGQRVFTTYWRCCKSSGAMALEELPALAYRRTGDDGIAVDIYGPSQADMAVPAAGVVRLEQITGYPFDGRIRLLVKPEDAATFPILLRIPSWAANTTIRVNGLDCDAAARPGSYARLSRTWQFNDEIEIAFDMPAVLNRKASFSVQESTGPDGELITQEVMHRDYVAITRGPLVYATSLIDSFKSEESVRLNVNATEPQLELLDAPAGFDGPAIRMHLADRAPLVFQPWYEAGGRRDGSWRLTWLPVADIDKP